MSDFSKHIVNTRFRSVYLVLEEHGLIRSKSGLAKSLGTYNHIINQVLKGGRNITLDQLLKLCETYQVNANYLFGLSERMFLDPNIIEQEIPQSLLDKLQPDQQGNIAFINRSAEAGYAIDPADWKEKETETVPRFSLPGFSGDHLAFEIRGDSMMPTLTDGDWVVCRPVTDLEAIRENRVYILVTDNVVAKRVQPIRDGKRVQSLRLMSDNHEVYRPYEVPVEQLTQILEVRARLTDHALGD